MSSASVLQLWELEKLLLNMEPGKKLEINHETLATLFPPGAHDQASREAAFNFAKQTGCRIENYSSAGVLWFVKDPPVAPKVFTY